MSDASWVFLHIGEHILPAILSGDNMRRILGEKKEGAHGYLQRPSTMNIINSHSMSQAQALSAQSSRMSRSQNCQRL